jgi:spore maturation protein CgeB
MKIAFFASSLVSAYWNGAATYYRGLLRALAREGYEINFYEPDAFERQKHRDIPDPDWARVCVYSASDHSDVDRCLEEAARGAGIVVKASGVGVFDEYLERRIAHLEGPSTRIFWDVDAPATLTRLQQNSCDPFHAVLPQYDLVFTYGGGDPVVRDYRAMGARECIPIYNAVDPETHYPVPPDARFSADLTFLGNRLPDREKRVDEFFFSVAGFLPTKGFLLGGNGWQNRALPANVRHLGHVYTRDHNALNSSALALLNISRESMARYGFSPATRVFEAAAAAGCLITDDWEGLELFLRPSIEVIRAASGQEVATVLQSLTPERARCIGDAARDRVLRDHTYTSRARQVSATLKDVITQAETAALQVHA